MTQTRCQRHNKGETEVELTVLRRICTYLDGHSVAALGGDDAVVSVVVDLVVVDGQEVAVVVGVEAVLRVVVHLVPPPVSPLVAIRVDPEVVVVDVRVVDVAVDVDLVEHFRVASILAEPSHLVARGFIEGILCVFGSTI